MAGALPILSLYARALSGLARNRWLAAMLALANLAVAGFQFVDPVLFGRVIQMLSDSDKLGTAQLWSRAATLLGIWAVVGVAGIAANIIAALQAERLAHRNRLEAMRQFYEHVLGLPLAFHGEAHSGRMVKIMLAGADAVFWLWLTFFREQFATIPACARKWRDGRLEQGHAPGFRNGARWQGGAPVLAQRAWRKAPSVSELDD